MATGMKYASLGRTGVMVSRLCLGTMNFGSRTSEDEALRIINRAIESGVNFIDTADLYGEANEGVGRCEEIIGRALTQNGKRDRIVLATKVFYPTDESDPNAKGLSRRHIMDACEASLKRLKTDHIDLYQMHRPDPDVPIEETLKALDDLVQSGKVRYIGTSQFPAWRIVEALWTSDRLMLNRLVTEQPFYNLIDRSIEADVVPLALKYGIGILPYSPLGGGILTGKYRRGKPYPEDSRFAFKKWAGVWDSDLNEKVYQLLDMLDEMAKDKGCTVSQIALAWTMAQPCITSVIIGPRTESQLIESLGAVEVSLSAKDIRKIEGISKPREILK